MTDYTLAACQPYDTDIWYADDRHRSDQLAAIAICQGCPIREDCAQDAITTGDPWGIRGGLTESERRRVGTGNTLRPHGTNAAYQRHLYRGEKPCPECSEASRAAGRQRTYRAKRRVA